MIKAIKEFEITSLKLSGFKCFAEERSFTFGHMNAILGHNAQGKSTIADAISFAIAGVSFFGGTRLDRLHTPGKDIYVELQFVDGEKESHRLIRQRCGDKTDIFLDGLPITQKEINSIFVERDLFLSVFNPLYFIEVLGNKGRDLFERYTPDISHESVMEHLSENSRSILAQHPFHSPEALCKRTREEIRQLEQTMIYRQGQNDQIISQKAQSEQRLVERKAALEECRARAQELDAIRTNGFDGSDLKEKLAGLYARYEELIHEQASIPQTAELDKQFRSLTQKLEQRRAAVYQSQYAQALSDAQKKVNALGMELNRHRKVLAGLQPGVRCGMCYQVVTEDTLPAVKREFEAAIRNICLQGKEQAGQLQELQELDAKAKAVFESYRSQDMRSNFITSYLDDLWKREYPGQDRGFIHTCEWEELTLPLETLTAAMPSDMEKAGAFLERLRSGTADFPPLVCVNRVVIDGLHRFWAYQQAGYTQVRVYQNKPWILSAAA